MFTDKRYGYFSEQAANQFGYSVWATPDGREVHVTCIDRDSDGSFYKWPDRVDRGEVTHKVRESPQWKANNEKIDRAMAAMHKPVWPEDMGGPRPAMITGVPYMPSDRVQSLARAMAGLPRDPIVILSSAQPVELDAWMVRVLNAKREKKQ